MIRVTSTVIDETTAQLPGEKNFTRPDHDDHRPQKFSVSSAWLPAENKFLFLGEHAAGFATAMVREIIIS